jgi:hypothetical protein
MKDLIAQYSLVLSSNSKEVLYKAHQDLLNSDFLVSSNFKPKFHKDILLHSCEVLVSISETKNYVFSDFLDNFLDNHDSLTLSSAFTDSHGKGVLEPDLTKTYITTY